MQRDNRMGKRILFNSWQLLVLILCVILLLPMSSAADNSLCARVKIEIKQELTLERQAFDAHMRINNGLSHVTLENVDIDVSFTDREGNTVRASYDPHDTSALFFIRVDTMDNVNDVNGTGRVQPSTSADIHWLIIPAPGASNGLQEGTLYYVGATLTYTIGGEEYVTDVTPDYIFVKPMPFLALDYFLPIDVYGDDAFTTEIEPPIPFNLGVRVKNNGFGAARNLKIDSAQPEIVENEQGLLINFVIEGCEVNGGEVSKTLLADFGDIEAHTSGVARWVMICTLSGQFVSFEAEFSHADELGGELTSLLEATNTHFLIRDVLVDLPGRDNIRDFLAKDSGVYRIYESESVDTDVTDQSSYAGLQFAASYGSQDYYTLSIPPTAGFMYVQMPDPCAGQMILKEVVRSDGKRIKPENAWLSKTRNEDHSWRHLVNVFDVNTTDFYTLIFADPADESDPPVLQFIPNRTQVEEQQLSFIVEASDPDGTVPALLAAPLPPGANFTDQGDGTGIFDWTPTIGQAGIYQITFSASDGELRASQRATHTIISLITDSDTDGLPDDWELQNFWSLDRNGTEDFDEDGLSDIDEYLNNMDPAASNAPTVPEIDSPANASEVADLQPDLVIINSLDPEGDTITYSFELYSDQGMSNLVAGGENIPETSQTTSCAVPSGLSDNSRYYWRAKATDGMCTSQWAYGSFFVNMQNDPPGTFNISSPQDNSEVDTQTPTLEVTNSIDVDGDTITYGFEVYEDDSMNNLVDSASQVLQGEGGTTSWQIGTLLNDNTPYYWKAIASDEHQATTESILASFFVNIFNDAPTAPAITSPGLAMEVCDLDLDLVVNNAVDLDGDIVSYFFEIDKVNTFDGQDKQISGEITEGNGTTGWHVSGLIDNTQYYWRVKASDGAAESAWTQGNFFINTANDSPTTPTLKNPGQGAWVTSIAPQLELNPAVDVDNDSLMYRFEVYSDDSLANLIVQGTSDTPVWVVPSALSDNTSYYWRAQTEDEHGAVSGWMQTFSFFVNDGGMDDPPTITVIEPAIDLATNGNTFTISWDDTDPDSNADIGVYYDIDSFGGDGVLIASGITEDPDEAGDSYLWDISPMRDGIYYIYATISDGTSSTTHYAPGVVTIDRTPPLFTATPPGGTYIGSQNITLSSDETATIYYTLDGSDPTVDSLQYSSAIGITEDTTVRFMATDALGNQSGIVAEIYTIEIGAQLTSFEFEIENTTIQPGVAFSLTIKAVDAQGFVFTDFTGYVTLSVAGGTINPGLTDQFINGVWFGQAQITAPDGSVTITAHTDEIEGMSEALTIVCAVPPAPTLGYPYDGAQDIDETTTFNWNIVQSADYYTLKVARDLGLTDIFFIQDNITVTYYLPLAASFYDLLETGQTYYWSVRGVNECGAGLFNIPRTFMLTDQVQPSITLTAPIGGETLYAGDSYVIQWDYTGDPGSTVKMRYNTGGRAWYDIATGIFIGETSYVWNVPSISTSTCIVKIESEQDRTIYYTSETFTITIP